MVEDVTGISPRYHALSGAREVLKLLGDPKPR